MNFFILPVLLLLQVPLAVQQPLKAGKYKGGFSADGRHALIVELKLKKNNTYVCHRTVTSLASSRIKGNWEVKHDTLYLYPEVIKNSRDKSIRHCKKTAENKESPCPPETYFIYKGGLYFFKKSDTEYSEQLK